MIQRRLLCPGGTEVEVDLDAMTDDELLDEVARGSAAALDLAVARRLA